MAETRSIEAATVTLTFIDGKTLTLDFGSDGRHVLEAALSLTAELREVPSNGMWVEREATGRKTGHLVLSGPVVRTEHGTVTE